MYLDPSLAPRNSRKNSPRRIAIWLLLILAGLIFLSRRPQITKPFVPTPTPTPGAFVFAHGCGGNVEAPVSLFARPKSRGKSLAGSHACPGMCYYEESLVACSAVCDGSLYRRVAEKLTCGSKAVDDGWR